MTLWYIYRVKDGWMEDIVREVHSETKPRVGRGFKAVRGKFSKKQRQALNASMKLDVDPRLAYPSAFREEI